MEFTKIKESPPLNLTKNHEFDKVTGYKGNMEINECVNK